jgi:Predicted hydrolases or acyltransferases (alpha/beta hydrolase superfamily)
MKRFYLVFVLLINVLASPAQSVDTVNIYSKAMQKNFNCVVIRPVLAEDKPTPLPVVYLLHGYGGGYANWIKRVPELKDYAQQFRLMIVCPDGGYSSWYFEVPSIP